MLKLPSRILQQADARTFRQYGSVVCRCFHSNNSSELDKMILNSFEDGTSETVKALIKRVKARISASLPATEDRQEDVYILPPLFLHSSIDGFYELSSELFLVACELGPIFPFVRVQTTTNTLGDEVLLENLFDIYDCISDKQVRSERCLEEIFNKSRAQKTKK